MTSITNAAHVPNASFYVLATYGGSPAHYAELTPAATRDAAQSIRSDRIVLDGARHAKVMDRKPPTLLLNSGLLDVHLREEHPKLPSVRMPLPTVDETSELPLPRPVRKGARE